MPDTLHPPFVAGAQTIPRQLNRWLDVNPQGGPLKRTQSYITLPAFSQVVDWKGYSEIVASFNFTGPNNFSLKSVSDVTNPNYALCISWHDGSVMHRYAIWSGVGEVWYFEVPAYEGQKIAKNFRFEIWSTDSTPAVQTADIVLYTSVRGTVDYRFGTDFQLVDDGGVVSSFSAAMTQDSAPAPTQTGMVNYWSAQTGVTIDTTDNSVNTVTDIRNGAVLTNNHATGVGLCRRINKEVGNVLEFSSTNSLTQRLISYGSSQPSIGALYLVFRLNEIKAGSLVETNQGNITVISVSSTQFALQYGTAVIGALNIDRWHVLNINTTGIIRAYQLQDKTLHADIGTITLGVITNYYLGKDVSFDFLSMFTYSSSSTAPQADEIFNSLHATFMGLNAPLPLTFPSDSISQPN